MKSKQAVLILFLGILFSCSQNKIVELPLTIQKDHSPFGVWFAEIGAVSENENDPWKNSYLKVSNFPESLTDMKYGYIHTNIYQFVYQNYLLGNITKEFYEQLQKSWNWEPDTLNLSKNPIRTEIAFAYGKDAEGVLKIVVDANGNLDLNDDRLFTAFDGDSFFESPNKDSLLRTHSHNVSFETFVQNKIIPVNSSLFIIHDNRFDILMSRLALYATTQYKGKQIAVSLGNTRAASEDKFAFIDNLKKGELINDEDTYEKNEYVEIGDEIYKILDVNTNKFTLTLEKIDTRSDAVPLKKADLSEIEVFSTRTGDKLYPVQGEEFTTKKMISLDSLKGKYVLLDFYATWCLPCIDEIPKLKELYSKTDREKLEIIGILGQSSSDALKRLINNYSIDWPQIMSNDDNLLIEKYGISYYPTTFLLDPEGVIIATDLRGKELEEKVLSLIND